MIFYQNKTEALIIHNVLPAPDLMANIVEAVNWSHNKIKVYGKEYDEPRLTAWFGPPYKYSSIQWPKKEIPEFLSGLKSEAESLSGFTFNSVLLNYYRNGADSMGWHSDSEPEMNQECIVSISLGETRKMKFRHRDSKQVVDIELKNGDLLIMRDFQRMWQHSIPKTTRPLGPRLNLTFRQVLF